MIGLSFAHSFDACENILTLEINLTCFKQYVYEPMYMKTKMYTRWHMAGLNNM